MWVPMKLVLVTSAAWALVPSTIPARPGVAVKASDVDIVPVAAAGGVVLAAVGAAVLSNQGKSTTAAPAAAPPKAAAPKKAAPPPPPPVVASGGLTKACWSGDAFKGYEWPSESVVTTAKWRETCDTGGVVSYYDFGLRTIEYEAPAKTVEDWRAACADGVMSFYDFGVRL
mmetsp:Transcript_11534/g.29309  ORF Transcript_11534/g.29309 Transcript_11534/m.29309 type:complete len:171 (+) Transcript_11534:48-560(+)